MASILYQVKIFIRMNLSIFRAVNVSLKYRSAFLYIQSNQYQNVSLVWAHGVKCIFKCQMHSINCMYVWIHYIDEYITATLLHTDKVASYRQSGQLFHTLDFQASITPSYIRLLLGLSFIQQCDMRPRGCFSTSQPFKFILLGGFCPSLHIHLSTHPSLYSQLVILQFFEKENQ